MNSISIGKSLGWAAETFFNQWRLSLKILLFPLLGVLIWILLALPLAVISSSPSQSLNIPVPLFGKSIYGLFLLFAPMVAFFVFRIGIIRTYAEYSFS